jgi:hypothetical protein
MQAGGGVEQGPEKVANEHLPYRDLDLIGDPSDARQLTLRAPREQWNAGDELDLGVAAETYAK